MYLPHFYNKEIAKIIVNNIIINVNILIDIYIVIPIHR
jgi:hypothetical protein